MNDHTGHGRLKGKVALVTGGGRGIGRATADLFAREGARVVICARTQADIDETAARIVAFGGTVQAVPADIGVAAQAQHVVRFAVQHFGRLDIVINNAGILGPRVAITEYPPDAWAEVLRINLTGTFHISQAAAQQMTRQGHGCIITLSSSVGRHGRAEWGAYAVSKFGAEGLSQVMADELRAAGVCVLTFNPGGTRTEMRTKAYPDENSRSLHAPAEVAQALARLATNPSPEMSGRAYDFSDVP